MKDGFFKKMTNPEKFLWVTKIRNKADGLINWIPWPNINPDLVSFGAFIIILPIIFFTDQLFLVFIFLFFSILLDWSDGLIARKYNRQSTRGYWVDLISDRLGEAVLAFSFGGLWLALFATNIVISFYSWQVKTNFVMPVRLIFLLLLILKILNIDFGLI